MKKKLLIILSIIVTLFIFLFNSVQSQDRPFLYFSSSSLSLVQGQTVNISIYVNTVSFQVNTISAHIKYPTDKLEFISSSFTDAALKNVIERSEDTPGELRYTTFTRPFFNGASGKIADLTFEVVDEGQATLEFLPTSGIYAADGSGTNVAGQDSLKTITLDINESSGSPSPPVSPNPTSRSKEQIAQDEAKSGVIDYVIEGEREKTEPRTVRDWLLQFSPKRLLTGKRPNLTTSKSQREVSPLVNILTIIWLPVLILLIVGIIIFVIKKRKETSQYPDQTNY